MRLRGSAVLLALVLAACGQGAESETGSEAGDSPSTTAAAPAEPATPGPDCVETTELTAVDDDWEPQCVIVPGGSLTVKNEGEALHSFTIELHDAIDVDIKSGTSVVVDAAEAAETAGEAGETFFQCKYHPGMSGFLWVA